MAASNNPIYTTQPLCSFNTVQSGNTNTDGATGIYSSGLTFGVNGALVDYIKAVPITTVSGIIRIFYNNNQSGFNGSSGYALWDQITYTSGTTAPQYWFPGGNTLWNVAAGSLLQFSVSVNDTWKIWVHYSCY